MKNSRQKGDEFMHQSLYFIIFPINTFSYFRDSATTENAGYTYSQL